MRRRAFTLVELMVVIAIIALLLSLVVTAIGGMMTRTRATKDLANQRGIGKADWSFSVEHDGRLLHPRTEHPVGSDPIGQSQEDRMWVRAYGQSDETGEDRVDDSGPVRIETEAVLRDGAAFPYIDDIAAYRSPLEPHGRIRSYSLNAFVGVEWGADDNSNYDTGSLPFGQHYRPCETAAQVPMPSSTMACIAEDDKQYGPNVNGWMVHPLQDLWIDCPPFWIPGEVGLAYIDGSTETMSLSSKLLEEAWIDHPTGHSMVNPPGCKDLRAFRRLLLPGVVTPLLDSGN